MKKISLLAMCLLLLISLFGCTKKVTKISTLPATNSPADTLPVDLETLPPSDILMTIKDGTLTESGCTLVLENRSEDKYWYSGPFSLEVKNGDVWQPAEVKEVLAWDSIAFELASGETVEATIDWVMGYGELSAGTYRIAKTFVNDASATSEDYTAEFEID